MTDIDDQVITDPVLARLIELERLDKLTPHHIVDESVDPSSPFHSIMEWDAEIAAHRHRLDQARRLIGRYRRRVVIGEDGGTVITERRFTHVASAGRSMDTRRALAEFGDEVIEAARRDFRTFKLRYQRLAQLRELVLEELDGT